MADLAHATENDNGLFGDCNAQHWAERFAAMFKVVRADEPGLEMPTEDLMRTWFAGAIETGRMGR